MTLTDKLDILMDSKKINRATLSRESGIPYMTIANFYEKGTDNVKRSTLLKIAKYFGVTLDSLADDTIEGVDFVQDIYNKKYVDAKNKNDLLILKCFHRADSSDQSAILCILQKYLADDEDFLTSAPPSKVLSNLIAERYNSRKTNNKNTPDVISTKD